MYMMSNNSISWSNLYVLIFLCCVISTLSRDGGNETLHVGFYDKSCPQAERIVQDVVIKSVIKDSGVAASLLRLYFHDCFVNGCDASILLDKTPSGEAIEKTSPGNVGVRGFEVIDEAKTRLEETCPNTVSCADIIAFAARDSAAIAGIAPYKVPAGRRDGLKSMASNVFGNLPVPSSDVGQMDEIFTKKGMNKSDLVALLGVHSIGVAHCFLFEQEFRNFNSTHRSNPRLNFGYAVILRTICPKSTNSSKPNKDNILPLNMFMHKRLSTTFYQNVLGGRAVIPADQSLLDDTFTRRLVRKYSVGSLKWANDFRDAMVKLGSVEVLMGEQGQIRKNCRVINN